VNRLNTAIYPVRLVSGHVLKPCRKLLLVLKCHPEGDFSPTRDPQLFQKANLFAKGSKLQILRSLRGLRMTLQ
jgi:hypothetical protein